MGILKTWSSGGLPILWSATRDEYYLFLKCASLEVVRKRILLTIKNNNIILDCLEAEHCIYLWTFNMINECNRVICGVKNEKLFEARNVGRVDKILSLISAICSGQILK